jgi:hypothetical protein
VFVDWFTLARGYWKGIEQWTESGEALSVIILTVHGLLYVVRGYIHMCRTELMTKCMLTFVTGCYWLLRVVPFWDYAIGPVFLPLFELAVQNGSSSSFVDSFVNFPYVRVCATCGGMAWMPTVFNRSFLMFELRKPLKSLYSPCGTVTKSCFEHFMHLQCSVPECEAKQMHCPAIRKLRLHLTHTTINSHWEVIQRVMAAKVTRPSQSLVPLWHLRAESRTARYSQS